MPGMAQLGTQLLYADVGFEPDAAWLAGKEEALLSLLDGIEAEERAPDGPGKFGPTPNTLCGWCDYRPLCPEGRAFLAAASSSGSGGALQSA